MSHRCDWQVSVWQLAAAWWQHEEFLDRWISVSYRSDSSDLTSSICITLVSAGARFLRQCPPRSAVIYGLSHCCLPVSLSAISLLSLGLTTQLAGGPRPNTFTAHLAGDERVARVTDMKVKWKRLRGWKNVGWSLKRILEIIQEKSDFTTSYLPLPVPLSHCHTLIKTHLCQVSQTFVKEHSLMTTDLIWQSCDST